MIACPPDVATKLDVSRETLERLETYAALLIKWNRRINLVAPNTIDLLWTRHVLDSAQLYDLAEGRSGGWVDLGSGGGFPGVVIAILSAERSDLVVHLVESDARKATFLRTVIRDCKLDATVHTCRIEECPPFAADILSARALAPLEKLLGYAERHLAPTGIALFPKGAQAAEEVAEARKTWSFACEAIPSVTYASASILKIGDIARV